MTTKTRANIFTLAHKLYTLGFTVIPSGGGDKGKAPLVNWEEFQNRQATGSELETWQRELSPRLWGIVTSADVAVLDADTPETRAQLEAELGEANVITPRGGAHWYINTTGHPFKTKAGLLPGIDVRGIGGFVNIAGGQYQIKRLPVPGDNLIHWQDLPEYLVVALNGSKSTTKVKPQGEPIPETKRNATLASLAGAMRRKGADQSAIEAALLEVNARQCQPPLSEHEVLRIAGSISQYEPVKDTQPSLPLTDTGNGEFLANLFGSQIRYDHRRRRWLLWKDHLWEPDRDGHIARLAIEAARERFHRAAKIEDLEERARIAKHAISSESRMRIEACLSLAKNIKPLADSGENWDTDIWLLGVKNGVIDLRTGELRPGQPEGRITMTTGIDFDPQAKCPRWQQFLSEVFDDAELIDWLWRALGYSITGDTTEQCIFMGHGVGANGKGVLTTALHGALGDYAFSSPFSTFELYQRASIPNDLAALEFRRFVSSSETNDNTRLNEARIKAISGCDPITARYLHQEYFSFWPHLKLWLFVNHKPKVIDDSLGFWRRVRLIPFTQQFIGTADDHRLSEKLRVEAPGILVWLVHGCLEWQKRGLEPAPECVRAATQEYRQESDILAEFITGKCIEHPGATVKASGLYSAYKQWADAEGLGSRETLTATAFGRRMHERYTKVKGRESNFYSGIGLKCGGFVEGFEANDTGNDVFPICNTSRVETKKTIHNYPHKAKTGENYPQLPDCPQCGRNEWVADESIYTCPCGNTIPLEVI
jgi:putative DNA primase/helicase